MARFNYEAPAEFDRIVRKCLEKDRERRYQSARDLLTDLRNLERDLAGTRETAPEVATSQRAIKVIVVDDEELARRLLREYLAATEESKWWRSARMGSRP